MSVITGFRFASDDFYVRETDWSGMTDHMMGLVDGRIPVLLVPEALSPSQCDSLRKSFADSPETVPRADGVAGDVLGAYHYAKDRSSYVEDVAVTASAVQKFLAAADDPVRRILTATADAAGLVGATVRPAEWEGREAALARALSWAVEGDYMLAPHDDVGQLTDPRQAGFEAQAVAANTVVAVNLYPHVPAGGGLLRLWNIVPDAASRDRCGTTHTGYPYDAALLGDFESLDVEITNGAIVLMNGGLVHGVTGYRNMPDHGTGRLLINLFLGRLDNTTIVHWV